MSYESYQDYDKEGPGPVGYLALVLAWAVPGLGHFILGERKRGILFAVALHGLFAGGLLVGGIKAINPPDQAIWTYTQFLTGWPMVVANKIEHNSREEIQRVRDEYTRSRPESPADRQAAAKSYISGHPLFVFHPKVQDIGAVYCGIAGMLNLLVMFDVLLRITGAQRQDPLAKRKNPSTPPASPTAAATAEVAK